MNINNEKKHETAEATHEEICDGALMHYEDVSKKASHWCSTIPRAIEFYKKHGSPNPEKKCEAPGSNICLKYNREKVACSSDCDHLPSSEQKCGCKNNDHTWNCPNWEGVWNRVVNPTPEQKKDRAFNIIDKVFSKSIPELKPQPSKESREVELAEEGTVMAVFQKLRTDAISKMFDRDPGCGTLHTTSHFFHDLDKGFNSLISQVEFEAYERGLGDADLSTRMTKHWKEAGRNSLRKELIEKVKALKPVLWSDEKNRYIENVAKYNTLDQVLTLLKGE